MNTIYIIAQLPDNVKGEYLMKKAVFYGRYSSTNQNEQSIEGQLHVCERYAQSNDIMIVGQYIDRA